MSDPAKMHYDPEIAARAVMEVTNAMRDFKDMDYAKALLSDPRLTSNMGLMASCGLTTREVKRAKECMKEGLPTLEAQRRAIQFLNEIDQERRA